MEYLHDFQKSLHAGGGTKGAVYQTWLVSMVAGLAHTNSMLVYLLARGVPTEAAASARRALEYLGMLSHLVREPDKAAYLSTDEVDSEALLRAFIRGPDREEAYRLKEAGIAYRFSALSDGHAKMVTKLYGTLSRYGVHGGTMSSLINLSLAPTQHSCAFGLVPNFETRVQTQKIHEGETESWRIRAGSSRESLRWLPSGGYKPGSR